MGPGYFPFALGAVLAALGSVVLLRGSLWAKGVHAWPALQLKPVGIILFSVVLFSLILRPAGLLVSTAALVLLTSSASHEFAWKEALLNAAVLVGIVLAVFVYFLEFQIPVWPSFIAGRI
jgi:Zn-dependent membrane protease YugP